MEVLVRKLEKIGIAIAGTSIIITMLVISTDALMRYGFNFPLRFTFEIVTLYLMIPAVYFAVSNTFTKGDHISINILRLMMPPRLRAALDILCSLLALVVFALIAYGMWGETIETYRLGRFYPGYVAWPIWLSYLPIAVGATLLVLRFGHHCFVLAIRGDDPHVEFEGEIVE